MNQQQCDPKRFSSFVRGELSDEAERDLTRHLDECETCGQALEHHVAEPSAWHEAGVFLGEQIGRDREADLSGTQSLDARIEQVLSQLLPTDDPDSLGRIGGYEVTGVVGSGGMGVVLKARDHSLDRVVAVKLMAPHLATSGSARQRFAREAKAAAAVLHPNVIAIHGVSNEQTLPYLVMPYVPGESLQKRIDEEGPLPLVDILRIGVQVAAGLAAAHEQGLVHRDIKPGNILLEKGVERVTITDFGLARAVDDASVTRSGVIAGTPQYMSPEQARGEAIDARSDLFSLGSLLYAMCAGHSPFRAETSFGVIHRITHDEPRTIADVNPDIPVWLENLVMRLLCKQAEDRLQTAAEVAELLEGCLSHTQNPATTPLPAAIMELSAKRKHGSWWQKLVAASLFLSLLAVAGVLIVLDWDKGTLRIESDTDDVPIRIVQGQEVVEELTVSRSGKSVRIAAGSYEVEIGSRMDAVFIEDGEVSLQRGGEDVIRIVSTRKEFVAPDPLEERLRYPKEESFGIAMSTRVYDVSEFVDFDPDISRQMQFSTLVGLLQRIIKNPGKIDFWPSFDNIVVRGTSPSHDDIADVLKQLRFCKQQIRAMMSQNAKIERMQAELGDVPDADRTSHRSKFLQQQVNVAMVARSQQERSFELTIARLQAENPSSSVTRPREDHPAK